MPDNKKPWLPPRWVMGVAWKVHRGIYRVSGGRLGVSPPKSRERWGTIRLHTIGRRTGREHNVIVAYVEDGPNLVTLAMNGWGAAEPAWWLNLQAHPDSTVDHPDGPRAVRAYAAQGSDRERLWARVRETDAKLDEYAALRPRDTAVVVLEPRSSV